MGVKVPLLRKLAKEIVKGDWREFLKGYGFYSQSCGAIDKKCKDIYFEEVMIVGMVINLAKMEQTERMELVRAFIPLIDNWSVCDIFCCDAKWANDSIWDFLQPYLNSDKEFEIRFAVVMLMCYFLKENTISKVFESLKTIHYGAYYVDMAVAWCLATATVKFRLQTCSFIDSASLPEGVIKKYHQKVRDSRRVN